jgi:hypothetical protein
VLSEDEGEDDALIFGLLGGVGVETARGAIHMVRLSHEELCLLVVRRPVVFTARRVAALFDWRPEGSRTV